MCSPENEERVFLDVEGEQVSLSILVGANEEFDELREWAMNAKIGDELSVGTYGTVRRVG